MSTHIRILFYNSDTGVSSIASGDMQSLGVRPLPAAYSRNWNILLSLSSDMTADAHDIMFYNAPSGALALGSMTGDDSFVTTEGGSVSAGWTNLVEGSYGYFLFYNSNNGAGAITKWTSGSGLDIETVKSCLIIRPMERRSCAINLDPAGNPASFTTIQGRMEST